ncbi:MAG: hybrid sensor histidine kinase/response regulator [Blastocatellia bacterium]
MSISPENTILNVDDYAEGREAISQILRWAGFSVIEAETGGEALQLAAARRPQLILLDVEMPDLSGYEVCKKLKSDPATMAIPVLLLSGAYTEGEDRVRGLDGGADAYLCKPVESAELIATIRALLRMRRAEDRFRNLVDDLEAIVWEADAATGRFTFVSRRAEQMLGYPVERWLSEPDFLTKLIHSDDRAEALRQSSQETDAGRDHDLEYRAVSAAGAVRWLRDIVHVAPNGDGRPHLLRGVMVDVTERKQAEEEKARLLALEQAACRRAEDACRLKDEFLGLVSHELRAPLNSIQGWVRLLREGRLDPAETARALETIDNSARAQNRIINDLLDVSRIITGRLLLNLRPLTPAHPIETAVEAVRGAAEAKGILLEVDLDREAGPIYADADRLRQVFWNLLSNAVKFTPSGGRVTVEMKRVAESIEIRVGDSGPGIAPEFLPFVFDRFRQQDGSTTRRHRGLGLGLAIVRHLAEMHGGAVRAESGGDGQGATFVLTFPVMGEAHPQTGASRAMFEEEESSLDCPPELDGLRILVVDDHDDARRLMEMILTKCGGEVVTAASADEALEVMAQPPERRPEILISDIEMPETDGYQLLRRLRSRPAAEGGAIPAVALTAHARPEDRLLALAAGFQMHVVKPVDEYELVTVVASLTGRLDRRRDATETAPLTNYTPLEISLR